MPKGPSVLVAPTNAGSAYDGREGGGDAQVNALDRVTRGLILTGSIELSSRAETLDGAGQLLPSGMRVFVPSVPRRSILDNINALHRLSEAGLEPVPHIAARRLVSRRQLEQFLQDATGHCGVKRVLLIGGDTEQPAGPFESAESLLRDGKLADFGIEEIGIAGYPEEHPRIPYTELMRSLDAKLELAARQGFGVFLVTQFCLASDRLASYFSMLKQKRPNLPILAGIPGPTSPTKLLQYAKLCGVNATLRGVGRMGLRTARLGMRATADKQLKAIGEYCLGDPDANVKGVHIFSFGGFIESARWMVAHIKSA